MATPFAHTLRSLEVDGSVGGRVLVVLALVLLAGWTTWLFAADVEVTEHSELARVRVGAAGHELATARAGRVVSVRVALGDRVEAGQLIVELDDSDTTLALSRARQRQRSLDGVIEAHGREIAAERDALEALERAAGAAASEARARVDAAVASARLAESTLVETQQLSEAAVASDSELRRSEAEAERLRAATRELRSASTRERLDTEREARDRLATIVSIERQIASLEVELSETRGEIEALEAELEHHRLRAPVAGIVGELAEIERGAWIDRGEVVGVIVPNGEFEVVAQFEPAQAVGRIKPGQPALLRLAGFPWAQYGTVGARVETVASEPRGGVLMVELAIESVPSAITLEHGLPGSVEVQIERTSPANLLLRAAGRRLSGGKATTPTTPTTPTTTGEPAPEPGS